MVTSQKFFTVCRKDELPAAGIGSTVIRNGRRHTVHGFSFRLVDPYEAQKWIEANRSKPDFNTKAFSPSIRVELDVVTAEDGADSGTGTTLDITDWAKADSAAG